MMVCDDDLAVHVYEVYIGTATINMARCKQAINPFTENMDSKACRK